jgi:hypothetical protein
MKSILTFVSGLVLDLLVEVNAEHKEETVQLKASLILIYVLSKNLKTIKISNEIFFFLP